MYDAFSEQMHVFAVVIVVILKKQMGSGGGGSGGGGGDGRRVGCVYVIHVAETIWHLMVPSDSPVPASLPLTHGHDVSSLLPRFVKADLVVQRFNSQRLILSFFYVLAQYFCQRLLLSGFPEDDLKAMLGASFGPLCQSSSPPLKIYNQIWYFWAKWKTVELKKSTDRMWLQGYKRLQDDKGKHQVRALNLHPLIFSREKSFSLSGSASSTQYVNTSNYRKILV